MVRLLAIFALLTCLVLSAAIAPPNIQSLTPKMTMRQAKAKTAFSDFRSFNRRSRRIRNLRRKCRTAALSQFRTQSGYCNNLAKPLQGAADDTFLRLANPPRPLRQGLAAPNPRLISNIVNDEATPIPNDRGMSELVTFFGQFLDHTVTFIATNENKPLPIRVPRNDPVFKESQIIPFFRTESRRGDPINELSSYIDAAAIYAVDEDDALALRTMKNGRLKLPGNLLPKGKDGQFLAGDERVNENGNLIAMHTLWAREHNRVAAEVERAFPAFNDEQTYQLARHIVAAEFQAVVYFEFLPALTGRPLPAYKKYNPDLKAVISNRFSTAAFRVGHTLLNSTVNSIDAKGVLSKRMLRDSFFNPKAFVEDTIEGLFRGMMRGFAAEVDCGITGEVRNFLIDAPESDEQLDLPALNVQRGRDHRLPVCNVVRKSVGLAPFTSFNQISKNVNVRRKLSKAYKGKIQDVDTWQCGVCEDHAPGSSLGPLFDRIVRGELRRLRDGDRFYFETPEYFKPPQISKIPTIRRLVGPKKIVGNIFRIIIKQNTALKNREINPKPFFV